MPATVVLFIFFRNSLDIARNSICAAGENRSTKPDGKIYILTSCQH